MRAGENRKTTTDQKKTGIEKNDWYDEKTYGIALFRNACFQLFRR